MNVLSVGAAAYLKPALQVAPPKQDRESDGDSDGASAVTAPASEAGEFPAIGSTVDVRA